MYIDSRTIMKDGLFVVSNTYVSFEQGLEKIINAASIKFAS